jgi:exoribonuclease R
MTTEHQVTQEEKAYGQLLDKIWEMLSESARAVLREAEAEAYKFNLCHNYAYQPEEYDEAMEKMRIAAVELTDCEHMLLAKVWRAALSAAASIDSEDFETLAGYRAHPGHLHHYYRMLSGMVEKTLEEKRIAELQTEIAEEEPVDFSDIPF